MWTWTFTLSREQLRAAAGARGFRHFGHGLTVIGRLTDTGGITITVEVDPQTASDQDRTADAGAVPHTGGR